LRKHGVASVLIVDDDDMFREALAELIEQEGYTAFGVSSGPEALAYLEVAPLKPRLILLDLMMPIMDGWQLLNRLRQNDVFANIALIILSAHSARFVGQGTSAVSVRTMPKPIDTEALLELVKEACGPPSQRPAT